MLLQLNLVSEHLRIGTNLNIILPDRPANAKAKDYYTSGEKFKVLWLLHGSFGDYSDWLRKTNIELYATQRGIAVVMFSAMNTEYYSWPKFNLGYDPYNYLFEELMPLVYNWFPISSEPKDNFVAGLSMGGFGATLYGFNRPELFGGIGAFSGVPFDVEGKQEAIAMHDRLVTLVEAHGGYDAYMKSPLNVWQKTKDYAAALEQGKVQPLKLYFSCGDADSLMYEPFLEYKDLVDDLGLEARFDIGEGHAHTWEYWDISVLAALDYFGLEVKK